MNPTTTIRRKPALARRNPWVAAAHRRHAGPHGGQRKRERQQARRDLRDALRETKEGP
jgi:hypothetical protein